MQTVLIADDHPLFRSALRAAVGQVLPMAETHEADSLPALLELLAAHPDTDLILLDLRMPGVRGFSSLIQRAASTRRCRSASSPPRKSRR